ncbi:hypothetical protein MYP_4498 [Sporocytophaga myxococcoides]|uniref:Uncharacterized protein n=1 Tax=Sporocytophaga myxococcoides TaxID=153721 RepID=A0A098LMK5_9BACT|nr:hypothetical protein MYP_4498 [Sporocytophaga myxococcoides]
MSPFDKNCCLLIEIWSFFIKKERLFIRKFDLSGGGCFMAINCNLVLLSYMGVA